MTPKPSVALDVPPGDTGTELTGAEASAALERWFQRPRLTLGSISVIREGRWVLISVTFRKAKWAGVTLKLSRAWAVVLFQQLRKALEG